MVNLVRHDLEFILAQIRIAEAHAAGGDLAALVAAQGAPPGVPVTDPAAASLLPYGLRTVDGSYNNLSGVPGREKWGAADQPFVKLLTPAPLNDADGDRMDFGPGAPSVTNTNYGSSGSVADADPRIISNLIVDQTVNNPAVRAALSGDSFSFDHDGDPDTPELAFIPNVSPDEGLSSPFNSWMTLFGQFFDHGLDLVSKGGNGTVYVPLQQDDPLYDKGADGIAGNADDGHTNFMALTRVSPNPVNRTTAWVDQNQTYASTASKQIFMREYTAGPDGKPIATGHLLEGIKGGLATWADVKEQAATVLGIRLTDADVGNVPLIASDPYGNFIPGPNGYPRVVIGLGTDGQLGTTDDLLLEGNPSNPVSLPPTTIRTFHAFIDDIAHNAVPVNAQNAPLPPDGDDISGNDIPQNNQGGNLAYDDELLNHHFVTGDGRGNENIGLTAVHHVFHSEHNRIVEETQKLALASNDVDFLNEWLLVPVDAVPTTDAGKAALVWNGERLFQAGRFTTEMEYQHLVFEEFARKIQPDVDVFVFNPSPDINPNISAEFANVVYRFGHSMLTETVDIIKMVDGKPEAEPTRLLNAFLDPDMYDGLGSGEEAAGAIIRGMTRQVGNEIDEFVTSALRDSLLGLPLDLATINLARGRDTGMPSLNKARETFYAVTNNDTQLKPYESWVDFAENLKNPASIINFVAAYGTHESITGETTMVGKRAAAAALVLGQEQVLKPGTPDDPATLDVNEFVEATAFAPPGDRVDFLNSTGTWANRESGLNTVDFWVGGLAEKKMAFGGMLGSTFSFVFEQTMEHLQDGDRFYYLSRTQGLNLLNELENNSFSDLIMLNTDLGAPGSTVLPGDSFSAVSIILEMNMDLQLKPDPVHTDPTLEALNPMVSRKDTDNDGDPDYIKIVTNEHVVIGGTEEDDTIISGGGDDALWGRGGNDYIEAGFGVDKVHGDDGDDIIVNAGTDIGETDFLHGGAGNDVIHGGSGLALLFGNEGQDFLITGPDGKEAFGGTGNDFILGGEGIDFLLGNEGDDWLEAGNGFDTTAGDNSELFFNSTIIGHDVMFAGANEHDFDAESGDDIMVQGVSVMRNEGMFGYDWAIHKGSPEAAESDMTIRIFTTEQQDILRDRFDQTEALSGWNKDDVLRGDNRTNAVAGGDAETRLDNNELSHAGVDRIAGLRATLGNMITAAPTGQDVDLEKAVAFNGGNILLGGGGSDLIQGRGGDDYIDGDNWLNVRIRVQGTGSNPTGSAEGMTAGVFDAAGNALYGGKTLSTLMLERTLNPGQLSIVREIVNGNVAGDIDTAVYSGTLDAYTFTRNADGSTKVVGTDTGAAGDLLRNIERIRFVDPVSGATTAEFGINELVNESQVLTGGPGNDPLTARAGNDTMDGGLGTDTAIFAGPIGNYSFGLGAAGILVTDLVGTGGTDTLISMEQMQFGGQTLIVRAGTNGNSTTVGVNNQTNLVLGFNGNDTLDARAGNDVVVGGLGKDTLFGRTGADTFLFSSIAEAGNGIAANIGRDTIADFTRAQGDKIDLSGIDAITGGARDGFTFIGTSNFTAAGQLRYFQEGGNTIVEGNVDGAGGAEFQLQLTGLMTLTGSDFGLSSAPPPGGNPPVNGTDGNDPLTGAAGNDTLNGGLGTDTAIFADPIGNYSFALSGSDILVTDLVGTGGTDTLISIEQMQFGGQTLIVRAGTVGSGTTVGINNQTNLVLGFDGNDTLDARAGNDVVVGGLGTDTLFGRTGADTFLFSSIAEAGNGTAANIGRDTIADFTSAQGDKINLSGIDAITGGTQDSFTFIGATNFTGVAGQLRYVQEGGNTIVEGDVDGAGGADFQIQLTGTLALLNTDFIL